MRTSFQFNPDASPTSLTIYENITCARNTRWLFRRLGVGAGLFIRKEQLINNLCSRSLSKNLKRQ